VYTAQRSLLVLKAPLNPSLIDWDLMSLCLFIGYAGNWSFCGLWRYIEKSHADELQFIFTPGVEYTYAEGVLKVEGAHVETLTTVVKEFVTLCQKLAVSVAQETFQMPIDTNEDMLQDVAEKESLLRGR